MFPPSNLGINPEMCVAVGSPAYARERVGTPEGFMNADVTFLAEIPL